MGWLWMTGYNTLLIAAFRRAKQNRRALIGACIVIDALQNREGFCDDAQKMFLAVANKRFVGFLSAKSVTDIYYLTHHYIHSDKDIRAFLNTLLYIFYLPEPKRETVKEYLGKEFD